MIEVMVGTSAEMMTIRHQDKIVAKAKKSLAASRLMHVGADERPASRPSYLKARIRPDDPTGLSCARASLREQMSAQGTGSISDTAVLLASALVTDAFHHSGGSAYFAAVPLGDAVRLEVYDSSATEPSRREAAEDADSSRGMTLIGVLAQS